MARKEFFTGEAREHVRRAVERVESASAAELVVAVRPRSAAYREAEYLFGALVAFVVLLLLLFHPLDVPVESMPVLVLLGFALGVYGGSASWGIARAFTRRSTMDEAVAHAARAAFVDRGITRTSGRTGVLVFVSMLERRVEVVCDVGVDVAALGAELPTATEALRDAVARAVSIVAFHDALVTLAGPLARVLPRRDDDVNELPDEPVGL